MKEDYSSASTGDIAIDTLIVGCVSGGTLTVYCITSQGQTHKVVTIGGVPLDVFVQGLTIGVETSAFTIDITAVTGMLPKAPMRTQGLSATQVEVVSLALSGMTRQEIAEQLYVSVNTVKGHLYQAYKKLGVRNIREAGAVLYNSGPSDKLPI